MLRTSVITDEISQDLLTAARMARRFGLDALEIRSVDEKNPFAMRRDDFGRIREICGEYGLMVCCLASPLFKCAIDDRLEVENHIEGLKRCAQGAQILGAGIVRGFTFWRDPERPVSAERLADMFVPVVRVAREEGIIVAIESEPSVNTDSVRGLKDFLLTLDDPGVRAIFDPGNEICAQGAPPPYPDGYEEIRDLICHIHLKDMKRLGAETEPAPIGRGDVDFGGLFSALARDGYPGFLSLETHWRKTEKLDEGLLRKPEGSGFSSGGEEATEICLNILFKDYGIGKGDRGNV